MRRFSVLFITIFVCCAIQAQSTDDFQQFRQKMLGDYQQFRKSVLDDYASYLEGVWKEFESFAGIKRQDKPKPVTPPDVKTTPAPEPPATMPTNDIPTEEVPDYKVQPKQPAPSAPTPVAPTTPMTSFPFYGITLKAPQLNCIEVGDMDKGKLAKAWREYDKNGTKDAISTLSTEAKALGLNDWFTYELIRECVNCQCKNSSKYARVALQQYILANMGYNIRLAVQGNTPLLLMPVSEMVYGHCFVRIDGVNYYEFDENGNDCNREEGIYTCELPKDADLGSRMNFIIRGGMNIASGIKHDCTLAYDGMTVTISVDTGLMEMLRHYPQMDIPYYAASMLVPSVRKDVLNQLRPYIEGLSQGEAANRLLHFVQFAFDYATDQQQHGYEKSYFFEENFYYPKNDCEDRAIFYAYLVNKLLGLDVHLIQFPGHECTAVHFTDSSIKGNGYVYDGRTYIICDPTYIGSDIGMCMPDYEYTKPIVQVWLGI